MKLLAFDTSTDPLSIAVQHGTQVWQYSGPGGAQSSARLIPAILDLLQQAGLTLEALDAIVFGRGPGSFTGLRTACAVAQGLAWGAQRPVLAIDTLLAVAEEARATHGATEVLAVLDARMDEVYHAPYCWDGAQGQWQALAECALCAPEALALPAGFVIAGNAAPAYGTRLPSAPQAPLAVLPSAQALLRLAPALLAAGAAQPADQALPLYVRDKVAQTTAERAAARQAAQAGA